MKLNELKFEQGLGEVVTWGVDPLQQLVNIMDEELRENDEPDNTGRLTFIMYELRHKLEDLENTLHRFDRERIDSIPRKKISLAAKRREEKKRARELAKSAKAAVVSFQAIKESVSERNLATSQAKA
jgi:hypothetical protein